MYILNKLKKVEVSVKRGETDLDLHVLLGVMLVEPSYIAI